MNALFLSDTPQGIGPPDTGWPDESWSDELGPELVAHISRPGAGLRAVVVIDNTAIGLAIGGVRMAPDVSTLEALRLARAMTLKNAAAGLPHGGGKAVIFGDPAMPRPQKERLIRAFAQAIRDLRDYVPGPDMGTDETAMAWIRDETGRAIGLPRALGGIPLDTIGATGWGLFHAIQVALEQRDFTLDGARVVVQGFGAVGRHVAKFLVQAGALLVGVGEIDGTLYDPRGLPLESLLRLKQAGRGIFDLDGGQRLERDAVLDLPCEIWIPAARPDVVREDNVQRLNTKLVAQGANIAITAGAERLLHQRDVLVLPDFIANAGGVICGAVEWAGGSEDEALLAIETKIRRNTATVLETAAREGVTPRDAALKLALSRVEQAMSFGRFAAGSDATGDARAPSASPGAPAAPQEPEAAPQPGKHREDVGRVA